jgi:hypothetical protein
VFGLVGRLWIGISFALGKNILKTDLIISYDTTIAYRSSFSIKLPQRQLSYCLSIHPDLLSNKLLFGCALRHLQSSVSQLLLDFLLNDPNVVHPGEQEIEVFHHRIPTGVCW